MGKEGEGDEKRGEKKDTPRVVSVLETEVRGGKRRGGGRFSGQKTKMESKSGNIGRERRSTDAEFEPGQSRVGIKGGKSRLGQEKRGKGSPT